jgi:hypothetical protein
VRWADFITAPAFKLSVHTTGTATKCDDQWEKCAPFRAARSSSAAPAPERPAGAGYATSHGGGPPAMPNDRATAAAGDPFRALTSQGSRRVVLAHGPHLRLFNRHL